MARQGVKVTGQRWGQSAWPARGLKLAANDKATSFLERFEKSVRLHMSEEEAHLFPLLDQHGQVDQIGTIQTLNSEHTKIRAAMGIIQAFFKRWQTSKEPGPEALALLEEEVRLKELLHQHHLREQLLMPDLDLLIAEGDRVKILERFTPVRVEA